LRIQDDIFGNWKSTHKVIKKDEAIWKSSIWKSNLQCKVHFMHHRMDANEVRCLLDLHQNNNSRSNSFKCGDSTKS